MTIQKIGVIGTGTMGAGIMQVAAQAGLDVVGRDIKQEFIDNGRRMVERMLRIAQKKPFPGQQAITKEEAEAALARIHTTLEVGDLADCDLVIEAALEVMEIKQKIFGELDQVCKPETLFASNTSSLSITTMAEVTKRPDRFLGMHFFNPVPAMKLVEIVRTEATSDQSYAAVREFCERIGKTVITARDTPAFIVNFLLMPYLLGAVRFYDSGSATREDIDTGMKLGCGHPMGPLELMDTIGIDVGLHVADSIAAAYPERDDFKAPQTLRDMVAANKIGKKTKGGFYDYGGGAFDVPGARK